MKRAWRSKVAGLLGGGIVFLSVGNCLPKDYWASSAQNFTIAVADSILARIALPILQEINPTLYPEDDDTSTE